ncbi:MAG: L,D-transpeptidase family protein [Rufibacter sp.]
MRKLPWLLLLFLLALLCSEVQAQTTIYAPAVQVARLRQALEEYRHLDQDNLWATFPEKACLRPGDKDPMIAGLRTNLFLLGDLPSLASATDSSFDEVLTQAVKNFQTRHGLVPDGIAGQSTLEALNITPSQRVAQLELNLNRWQADTTQGNQARVFVNLPDYTLHLLDSTGRPVWHTRVVIGQIPKNYQTVPLESRIGYLVTNPTWTVPQSILRREIVPMLRSNPNYLAQNNMVLYRLEGTKRIPVTPNTINWQTIDLAKEKLLVVQQPGPHNALGKVKFMFANPYDIYLHDTPAKALFNHPVRTYSHGCVRVQLPEMLAGYLMSQRWAVGIRALQIPQSGSEQKVFLPKPVPIKLAYYTAWVDDQGQVQFRKDIYGLDKSELSKNENYQ